MPDLLIVDDDVEASDLLSEILRADGHRVRVARNGREGLAVIRDPRPDLVLLDVEMPVLTGPDMAEKMFLINTGLESIPVILCSGVLDLPRVAAVVGTPYYLTKPFSLDALNRMIQRVLLERTPPRPALVREQHEAP